MAAAQVVVVEEAAVVVEEDENYSIRRSHFDSYVAIYNQRKNSKAIKSKNLKLVYVVVIISIFNSKELEKRCVQ